MTFPAKKPNRGPYRRKRKGAKGPLPEQVIYMAKVLEVIDNTETDTGYVMFEYVVAKTGIPETSLRPLMITMVNLGILKSATGIYGGYERLRKATLQELCSIVSERYDIPDPAAWGEVLSGFHGSFKVLVRGYLV